MPPGLSTNTETEAPEGCSLPLQHFEDHLGTPGHPEERGTHMCPLVPAMAHTHAGAGLVG